MRSQTKNHQGMIPWLFRGQTISAERLLKAEIRFESEIKRMKGNARFKRPNIAALLQHYGYKTSWLDVVDNLWIAIWFATHSMPPLTRREESGWIYFLGVPIGNAIDLREEQHGLSLRPHTQQGWSVRGADNSIVDLNKWVIACVEFPIERRWQIRGNLGSCDFFFPPMDLDNTLKILKRKKADVVAARVECECGLPVQCLGRVFENA